VIAVHDQTTTTVWRSEYSFRIDVTTDKDDSLSVGFLGDLDAVTARLLQRAEPIQIDNSGDVILDLTRLELVDMTGVREIRRIEQHIRDTGTRVSILGATPDVQEMLDLVKPSPAGE
jgi:anti-anti-sigma factor